MLSVFGRARTAAPCPPGWASIIIASTLSLRDRRFRVDREAPGFRPGPVVPLDSMFHELAPWLTSSSRPAGSCLRLAAVARQREATRVEAAAGVMAAQVTMTEEEASGGRDLEAAVNGNFGTRSMPVRREDRGRREQSRNMLKQWSRSWVGPSQIPLARLQVLLTTS